MWSGNAVYNLCEGCTDLGVADEDELGLGALGVEGVDGCGNGGNTLDGGVGVADVAAGGLATACGVVDGLRGGAGVGSENEVNDDTSSSVACGCSGLAGAKDVDAWAALALLDIDAGGECLEGEEHESRSDTTEHF